MAFDPTSAQSPEASLEVDLKALSQLTGPAGEKSASSDGGLYVGIATALLSGSLSGSMFVKGIALALHVLSGSGNSPEKAPTAGGPQVQRKSIFISDRPERLRERIAITGQSLAGIKGAMVTQEMLKRSIGAARHAQEGFRRLARNSLQIETVKGTTLETEVEIKAPALLPKDGANNLKPPHAKKSRFALSA